MLSVITQKCFTHLYLLTYLKFCRSNLVASEFIPFCISTRRVLNQILNSMARNVYNSSCKPHLYELMVFLIQLSLRE